MDLSKSGSEGISQIEETQLPLICGLPDDIALFCLARVPRKYHTILKCVSRRWRDLVCSEEWRAYREEKASVLRCWEIIFIYLGGCGWSEDATKEVYCYDSSRNSWTDAASLSTARCYFACEVLDEKIYSIGGLGSKSSDTHSWEVYDPCTDNWKLHTSPNVVPEIEDSFVMDGKIYIRCGTSVVTSEVYALVYEPSSCTWKHADADMALGWQGPAVVVDETLYVLDQSSGTRLMTWHKEIGKGCSTVVIDVGNAGNVGGVMVSTSMPKVNDTDDVIRLKCLAI
ncbi:hypothetical protein Patl1_00438 [Pistacia atlantica]|uniref:Uncharacterized protein n=1 Tax=Pistacia atlantica TaxID=434234 RepID=A0ACC1CAB5_9ROSI|nr:hypothetical protein Patl1_00438 [Pistacia atlantica]